jgi:hypothetical protein
MSDALDDDEKIKEAAATCAFDSEPLGHAWDWFKCHADQRIALFRFYVIVMGGLAAAVGLLHQQKEHILCAGLSIFAAFVCFCFVRLDTRTSDLVQLGERAMMSEQRRLSIYTGNDDFNIALKADLMTGPWPYTYRRAIKTLLFAAMSLFALFTIISVAESKHVVIVLHRWVGVTLLAT